MKRLAAVVIIIAGIAGWWLFHRGSAERIDLIAQFGMARKDGAPLFAVVAATLAGDTKMAISAPPNGRIHFRVRVPDDGRLNMSIGMQPASWNREGDSVYFFVGVAEGESFEVHFARTLNPFKNHSERRWIPVSIDLSVYAGDEVELLMNTRAAGVSAGTAAGLNDLPLWGAPEVVGR